MSSARQRSTVASSLGVLLLVSVAAVSVGLLLAACGGTSSASRENVVSLIVASHASAVQEAEVQDARILLVGECMRRKGFSYISPPPLPQTSRVGTSPVLDSGEVATTPPEASVLRATQRYGFGIAERREHPLGGAHPATQVFTESRTGTKQPKPTPAEAAYEAALSGPAGQNGSFTVAGVAQHSYSKEGCGAEAYAALYGSSLLAVEAGYLPEDLNLVVTHETHSSPAFLAASRRWSSCIEEATGGRAREPYNVANELLSHETAATGPVSTAERTREVKVATADVRCQYSTGLLQTSVALRRKFAAHLAGPYEGLLVSILEARAKASHKAQAILAAAGR